MELFISIYTSNNIAIEEGANGTVHFNIYI